MHLAGQARSPRPPRPDVPVVARTSRMARDGAVPPELRVLLAPERRRDAVAVLGDADAAHRAGLVDEDRLGRGRRDVDADDPTHRRGQPPVFEPRSTAQMCSLTMFSSRSWRPETGRGSISPAATRSAERRERRITVEDRRAQGARSSRRSAPRAARRGARPRASRPPPAGSGQACRCRRCGRGRGRRGPCSGAAAWRRS